MIFFFKCVSQSNIDCNFKNKLSAYVPSFNFYVNLKNGNRILLNYRIIVKIQ